MGTTPFNYNNSLLDRKVVLSIVIADYLVDISTDVIAFEIDFSIFGLSHGHLTLLDMDTNVFKSYAIMGGENLTFSITSPISNKIILIKNMQIYDVKPLSQDIDMGNNKNKFRIYFACAAIIKSKQELISKGYVEPKTTTEIALDIMDKKLGIPDKAVVRTNSDTIIEKYAIPYSYPLDIISFMAKISTIKARKNDIFIFYESFGNFNFVCLSVLLAKEPKQILIKNYQTDIQMGVPVFQVRDDKYNNGVNLLNSLDKGGVGSTYMYFDRKSKQLVEKNYNVTDDYLSGLNTVSTHSWYKKNISNNSKKSQILDYTDDGEWVDSFANYTMRMESLTKYNLKVKLTGNLDIDVGDVVYIEQVLDNTSVNEMISGNFLVLSIKLKYSALDEISNNASYRQFTSELIITKDGYGKAPKTLNTQLDLITSKVNVNDRIIIK